MKTSVRDPRAAAFVAEVDRALARREPGLRRETIRGLESHLAESLGDHPTTADVERVLGELGAPDDIARAANVPGTRRALARGWVPPVVLLLQAAGVAGLFLVPLIAPVAAIVLTSLSPRYSRVEKVLAACVSVAVPVGGALVFLASLSGMDGCFTPPASPQFPGQQTCAALHHDPGTIAAFTGGGVLLLAAAATGLVVAIRAGRRRLG